MKKVKKIFSIAISIIFTLNSFFTVYANQENLNKYFVYSEYIELLDDLINSERNYGLSGVQLAVYKDKKLIKNSSYGYTNNYKNKKENNKIIPNENIVLDKKDRVKITEDTMFDLASNTKMYATVYSVQKLVSEGKIKLDTKISEIFPEFLNYANENNWKNDIDLKMILSHRAGFVPSPKYHDENYDKADMIKNGKNDLYSQNKEKTFEMVMKTPLVRKPDTKWEYSDVDMMLAGFIVEKLTNMSLDEYVENNIYKPLNLDKIKFNPLKKGIDKNKIAATELNGNSRGGRRTFNNIRNYILQGEVHDEKAYHSFEGVAGHAGLFGSAKQIAYLAQAMIYDGKLKEVKLFDSTTIEKFIESSEMNSQAVGGWRRKSEDGKCAVWFSKFAPVGTIGHTGWTGTNTLIDRVNKLTVSLNTNARNTPIMGPKDNDFYTKNSNISSYGLVSELIYRALGLADDEIKSADELLIKLIDEKIGVNLEEKSKSYRNVVRAMLEVLKNRSSSNKQLLEYYNSDKIQNSILELAKYSSEDLKAITNNYKEKETLDESIKETEIETVKETYKETVIETKIETIKETNKEIKNDKNVKNISKNPQTGDIGLNQIFFLFSSSLVVLYVSYRKRKLKINN